MNEFNDLILKYTKINNRFLVSLANDERFPEIEIGIVFILATWSGSSIYQFSLLTDVLSKIDLGKIKIYILDSDKLNYGDLEKNGISHPQGFGETYWLKNHKIQHVLSKYSENDLQDIVSYTYELLSN